MSILQKRLSLTIVILLAFAALIAGIFVAQHLPNKKQALLEQFQGTLLDQPRVMKPFSLVGTDDHSFDNQSLQGHWTMMFFGFTNCGSICPVTMTELAKMYRILQKDNVESLPAVVMISIDPERDSLTRIADYVHAFNPHFYGARGAGDAVHTMASELGIVYAKIITEQGDVVENYNIQHSGAIMLFNPQGELAAFFTPPNKAEGLAKDYELLVN